ncbi:unnamed protein product [marine sediment metagenome]|uniref:Uncharacterized protein n=1 Tax=marine sediment metagenome TaxID=412755 RepID=X0YZW3_9ZZZZ
MVQIGKKLYKDIGLQREVEDALPYAVVGGAWEGSFDAQPMYDGLFYTSLNYVVPAGQQLKILFLRVWTQETSGARFAIIQENPSTTGLTGTTEAYPVVGSVPPGAAVTGIPTPRDYPMLEAAGAEVLTGSLIDPVHVLEGSIDFNVLALWPGVPLAVGANPAAFTDARYGITWWGVIKVPEPTR